MKNWRSNLKVSCFFTLSYFICGIIYKIISQLLGKNLKMTFLDILGVSTFTFIVSFVALLIINCNKENRIKNILEKYDKKDIK